MDSIYRQSYIDSVYRQLYIDSIYRQSYIDSMYRQSYIDSIYRQSYIDSIYRQSYVDSFYRQSYTDSIYRHSYRAWGRLYWYPFVWCPPNLTCHSKKGSLDICTQCSFRSACILHSLNFTFTHSVWTKILTVFICSNAHFQILCLFFINVQFLLIWTVWYKKDLLFYCGQW